MKTKTLFIVAIGFWATGSYGQNLENVGHQKPVKLSSGFSLQSNFYDVSGISPRQQNFSWFLTGSPVLQVYGLSLPFSFMVSNQDNNFQQPFNQFGVSPYYKWAKLHLGYSSMTFSPFTLSGHRFLGAGVELNPGKLRFAAMYGRLRKAVKEDISLSNNPDDFLLSQPVAAFKRTGYAFKLGVGSSRNYFDVIYFRAKEDVHSIPLPQEVVVQPEENAVVGLSWNFHFLKKFVWKSDLAVSAYTLDQNADSIPLTDFPLVATINKFLKLRNSTQLYSAAETSLAFQSKKLNLKLAYRRVEPDFKSMGVYFFQTDVEQFSFSTSLILAKRKVRIGGTAGLQRNNLFKTEGLQTKRIIGSAHMSINPNRNFGLDLSFSNFGISQSPQVASISDTILLEQVSRQFLVSPRINIISERLIQTISLVGSYNELSDQSQSIIYQSDMTSFNGNLIYNLNIISEQLNLNVSLFFREVTTVAGESVNLGFNAGIRKTFGQGKLTTALNGGFYKNRFEGKDNGNTFRLGGNFSVRLFQSQSLFTDLSFVRNTSKNEAASRSFEEFRGRVGFHFNF